MKNESAGAFFGTLYIYFFSYILYENQMPFYEPAHEVYESTCRTYVEGIEKQKARKKKETDFMDCILLSLREN